MIGRTRGIEAIDDLVVLARRGDLPESDERRFRELLVTSTVERELYEAGRAFDAEAPTETDDAERLERLVRNVERRVVAQRTTSRPRWIARIGLAALLITGAAVGAGRLSITKSSVPATAPPALEVEHGAAPLAPNEVRGHSEITQPEVAPPLIVEADAAVAPVPSHEQIVVVPEQPVPTPEVAPSAPAPTAPELFSAANQARVKGDLAEAIRLSRDLLDHFPDSAQAQATHVSLGMLYLQTQQASLALAEFRHGGDTRTAEAMWGECQALRALGQAQDERAALQALVARYPGSAYATVATKRLSTLP